MDSRYSSTVMQLVRQTQIIPVLVIMCILYSASMALPIKRTAANSYELIPKRDNTNGSITLTCREAESADEIDVNSTNYFLNSSKCATTDLREREGFSKVETVGCCSIKFILQRNLEGNYTCGARINSDTTQESPPVTLISLQTVVTLPEEVQTTFTAIVGGTAVLHCPIQPGALLQYYSVRWKKSGVVIADFSPLEGFRPMDSRYSIDRSLFSLTIHSVNVNDSDTGYKCEINVRTATGDTLPLTPSPELSLTLNVLAPAQQRNLTVYSTAEITTVCKCYWNGGMKEEKTVLTV